MGGLNPLDRPVWSSLTSLHAGLSEGSALALRYRPDVNVFAEPADDSPAALEALAALVEPGETIFVVRSEAMPEVPGLTVLNRAVAVQMVFEGPLPQHEGQGELDTLGQADAAEMLELATLTEPGPFRIDTRLMGRFVGVRREGRLAAMAGERLHFPGHCEVSGICTHPDFRGQGLALRLTAHVTGQIVARGETPFLHAWKHNAGAISLYERLGFRQRRDMAVTILARD